MLISSPIKKVKGMYSVFQLDDPITHDAYYIATALDIEKRIQDIKHEGNSPISYWLRALNAQNLEPEKRILAEFATQPEALLAKKTWIRERKPFLNGGAKEVPIPIQEALKRWKKDYPSPSELAYKRREAERVQEGIQQIRTMLTLTEKEAQKFYELSQWVSVDAIMAGMCLVEEAVEHTPRFTQSKLARMVLDLYGFYDK